MRIIHENVLRAIVANVYQSGGKARERLRLYKMAESSPRVFWSLIRWLRRHLAEADQAERDSTVSTTTTTSPAPPENEEDDRDGDHDHEDNDDDDFETMCAICGINSHPDQTLLCDGPNCENEYHTFCLTPKLDKIPEGDFFGPCCRDAVANGQNDTTHRLTCAKKFKISRWHTALENALPLLLPSLNWDFSTKRQRTRSAKAARNEASTADATDTDAAPPANATSTTITNSTT